MQPIDRLVVTHRLRANEDAAAPAGSDRLKLVTCLREVDIDVRSAGRFRSLTSHTAGTHYGLDAYRLLLEIAAGLHSEIPGETNVFGQFRRAWQRYVETARPGLSARLAPVMRRLFADTKTIRRNWLQGIGGHSYGSLVRRIIEPHNDDRILFVGHGDLARSMLPLFKRYQVGLWNRHTPTETPHAVGQLFAPGELRSAAGWADHVILTTPADALHDQRWRTWLSAARPRTIVHAGHRGSEWFTSHDAGLDIGIYGLDDLFRLRRELEHSRASKLERARLACAELAGLSARLPGSTQIAA